MSANNKKILVCVTEDLFAYEVPSLLSQLSRCGWAIHVNVSESAIKYVSPLSLSIAGNTHALIKSAAEFLDWSPTCPPDLIVVVPCGRNVISNIVDGCLRKCAFVSCPIIIAPAMEAEAWARDATVLSIKKAESFGFQVVQPTFDADQNHYAIDLRTVAESIAVALTITEPLDI